MQNYCFFLTYANLFAEIVLRGGILCRFMPIYADLCRNRQVLAGISRFRGARCRRIRRFWTANTNPEDRPWGLGRLGLPDRLPFSDCQVKAILQGDAKTMRKGNPLAELADGVFEYSSCHVDIFLVAFFPVAVFPAKREQPSAKLGGYIILYLRLRYSCRSEIT